MKCGQHFKWSACCPVIRSCPHFINTLFSYRDVNHYSGSNNDLQVTSHSLTGGALDNWATAASQLWNAENIFNFHVVCIILSKKSCLHFFYEMRATFSFFSYHILKKKLWTILGCPHFQKVISINIWKINVIRIFFWWNADNILSCLHVVRLSVVVRILSIPLRFYVKSTLAILLYLKTSNLAVLKGTEF